MGCSQTKTENPRKTGRPCRVSVTSTAVAQGTVEAASGSDVAVNAYRGIPYAQPPVGPLRFCPPKPQQLWTGDRVCTKFGPVSPQPMEVSKMIHEGLSNIPEVTSEDCLFLNVYTPATATADSRLPVMVWIHGGAFTVGFGDVYEGTQLVSHNNVVVVTINYRLGVLGFLTTGDDVIPGNNGLLDQLEALKWVQQHIAAFGGDPNNVTIFGESAGAMSSSVHVVSELGRGLFHRAILQSGTGASRYAVVSQTKARALMDPVLTEMGYKGETSEDLVSFLRSKTAEELGNMAEGLINFRVVVDGHVLSDFPINLYRDGKFQQVALITGTTSDEGWMNMNFMKTPPDDLSEKEKLRFHVKELLSADFSENLDAVTDAATQKYFTADAETDEQTFQRQYVDLSTHESFSAPNNIVAKGHSAKALVYTYVYAYRSSTAQHPEWVKAEHGEDVFCSLGFPFDKDGAAYFSEADRTVSRSMMKYWTNFARNGDPNGDGVNKWAPFTVANQAYQIIKENPEGATDYCADCMAFWEEEIPKLI